MRRREIIGLLGSAVLAWPLSVRAQQQSMPVIGFLNSASAEAWEPFLAAFRKGLSDIGYIEGRNVQIEYRWADEQYDRLPALAADLVAHRVSVIAANQLAADAAKNASSTIPVVFTTGVDPVQLGLVASLNQPGGNLTGITTLNEELVPKRLELLRDLVPTADSVVFLVNATNPSAERLSTQAQATARALGLELHLQRASSEQQLEAAFRQITALGSGRVVIAPDPFFVSRSKQLAALALAHSIPTIFLEFRQFVTAGGLMSYGGSLADVYYLAAGYVGRVLNGEQPSGLPVQRSTKVELFVNLKTAKALGISVPPTLLARADEVIE